MKIHIIIIIFFISATNWWNLCPFFPTANRQNLQLFIYDWLLKLTFFYRQPINYIRNIFSEFDHWNSWSFFPATNWLNAGLFFANYRIIIDNVPYFSCEKLPKFAIFSATNWRNLCNIKQLFFLRLLIPNYWFFRVLKK